MDEWFKAAWWDARKEDKEFRTEVRETFACVGKRCDVIEEWIAAEVTSRAVLKQQREIRAGHWRTVGSVLGLLATIAAVAVPFLLR